MHETQYLGSETVCKVQGDDEFYSDLVQLTESSSQKDDMSQKLVQGFLGNCWTGEEVQKCRERKRFKR